MRKLILKGLFTSLIITFSMASYADIVTVEPDDFADGADISNSFPGVALSTADGNPVFSAEQTSTVASTGTRSFALGTAGNITFAGFNSASPDPFSVAGLGSPGNVLRADFATPTDFVSIDVIPNDNSDPSRLAAYDAAGNLLQVVDEPGIGVADIPVTMSISRPSADIAFILASGVTGDTIALDNLRYEGDIAAIPTLSEWALILLMLSLVAIGVSINRKKTT